MKVEVVCTTDDPIDNLAHHQKIKNDGYGVKVLPAFRPDKAMQVENPEALNNYIDALQYNTGSDIVDFDIYLAVLRRRHHYFAAHGCRVSDHGLEHLYAHN